MVLLLVLSFALSGYSRVMAAEANLGISARELIERLARMETKMDERLQALERRIDENQKALLRQIDELKNFVLWGFGITFVGMFALVGFVLWDRRTALAPTMNQVEDLRRRERDIEEVLRKYASREPGLAEIMQSVGLLQERKP